MSREGPTIGICLSCAECQFCHATSETYEDGNSEDTSWDVYCHKVIPSHRIGNNWLTPDWCPYKRESQERILKWVLSDMKGPV